MLEISDLDKLLISLLSTMIWPVPSSRRVITLIKVDLPQPEGPAIPINSPSLISKFKLLITNLLLLAYLKSLYQ